jgi:hypothetical protein
MREIRREVPKQFTQSRNETGSTTFGYTLDATLVSYAPKRKKCVVLLSSEHTQKEIDANTVKPHIILMYNAAKGGVDHWDQMYYTKKYESLAKMCIPAYDRSFSLQRLHSLARNYWQVVG